MVVFLRHAATEVLDLGQHGRERRAPRLQPPPVHPHGAHHLVDLEPDQRQCVSRPRVRRLWRRRAGYSYQLLLVAIHGQFRVIVFTADHRLRALRLARPDVEEAELVPDESPHVRLQGRQPVCLAVAVQAHALGHANRCAHENRVSP